MDTKKNSYYFVNKNTIKGFNLNLYNKVISIYLYIYRFINRRKQRMKYTKMSTIIASEQCYCKNLIFSGFLQHLYNRSVTIL